MQRKAEMVNKVSHIQITMSLIQIHELSQKTDMLDKQFLQLR